MDKTEFISICRDEIKRYYFKKYEIYLNGYIIERLNIKETNGMIIATFKTFDDMYKFTRWSDNTISMMVYSYEYSKNFKNGYRRYYLRHRFLSTEVVKPELSYLNLDIKTRTLFLDSKNEYLSSEEVEELRPNQTKFTVQEIKNLKVEFDTDLADFELIPVEEN